jgi:hypothetical protein
MAGGAACLLLAMAAVHAGSNAQAPLPSQAAAADPQAPVPPTRYQSALGYRPAQAPATTPDRNWLAANQTVAAGNSMALTMKPMAGHAQHDHAGMHGTDMTPQAAAETSAPAADKDAP